MVKPRKQPPSLAEQFTPRTVPAPPNASIRETLTTPTEDDPLRHLTIQIPESLRTTLKVVAAQQNKSIRDLVTEAITTHLEQLR